MRLHIFAIDKPRLPFAKLGVEEYATRLRQFADVRIDFLKVGRPVHEGAALLERSKGMFRVILDERGQEVASRSLAEKLEKWEMAGPRDIAFLIGGADGHSDEVRQAAGWLWSLSRLTLQHEFALVLVLEQLYRACTIRAGTPYHRD
jgi:23S rRNA (pseudouridine1915-N3)-methyltransferase